MDILSLCWIFDNDYGMGFHAPFHHYSLFVNIIINMTLVLITVCSWGDVFEGVFFCISLVVICVLELVVMALIDHRVAVQLSKEKQNRRQARDSIRVIQTRRTVGSWWGFSIALMTSLLVVQSRWSEAWFGSIRYGGDIVAITYLCMVTLMCFLGRVGSMLSTRLFPSSSYRSTKSVLSSKK